MFDLSHLDRYRGRVRTGDLLAGRFELGPRIGAGGMGEVFRALDRVSSTTVAVKVMLDASQQHAARFTREAEVLAELSHPGIVRYVAHGLSDAGDRYLAMEWLEGEDLKARLARAPLSLREALTLVSRAAEALGMAHARGVVHRDLKPSNLFLVGGSAEHVKVLDFGIARLEGRTQLTETGVLLGTIGYMAPEQARRSGTIDARADVFSLGALLFRCLTGRAAFEGENLVAVLSKILCDEAPRVREICPDLPEEVDALCARMLAKAPEDRPRDGSEVAAATLALLSGGASPLSLRPPPPSITASERRMLSVVLMGSTGSPAFDAASRAGEHEGEADGVLQQAAERYGGRLTRLADGSALVTLTGDDHVATDHAARSARCALSLRRQCPMLPMVLVMGRAETTSKLPTSAAIDHAARLLLRMAQGSPASASPAPIVLDEVSAGLLDRSFEVVESAEGALLLGEHELTHTPRQLLGKPTSCVGREAELASLVALLTACVEESAARVLVVTAPAGMGKSRLCAELLGHVQNQGEPIAVWMARGDSLRAGSPLGMLGQALRSALGLREGAPLEARRTLIRAKVAEHAPSADQKRVTEFLGELVGAPFPGEDSPALSAARQDAQLMREQLQQAFIDFLGAVARARPVLLVLEDLHWGDAATVRFVDAALRDLGDRPFMVLSLARPEVHDLFPRLWADRGAQHIRLKELGRKASERLVRQVLGESVGAETVERLVHKAGGNAFYLEELIRATAEGRSGELPDTVLAMVEAHLARLSGEERRVLRAASVFGEVCWEGAIVSLLGGTMQAAQAGRSIEALVSQELLRRRRDSRFPGEQELAFRHALLRDGAYALLTEEDLRVGHALAGEWLEARGETDPVALGGHFHRGGDVERATHFYLRAAEQANHVGDSDAAIARAKLGLACEVPEARRIALLAVLCDAHYWQPELQSQSLPHAEELLLRASPGSAPWCRGAFAKISATLRTGQLSESFAMIRLLQETEPLPEAVATMALALSTTTRMLHNLGRCQEADGFIEKLHTLGTRLRHARLWWHCTISSMPLFGRGEPFEALEHAMIANELAHEFHEHRFLRLLELTRGMLLWLLGEHDLAGQVLSGMKGADTGIGILSSVRRFCLAWTHADRGALEDARATAAELCEAGRASQVAMHEGHGRWALAEALRRAGDLDGAEREITAALALLEGASPVDYSGALVTLSMLKLAQGDAARALGAATESLERSEAMGGACGFSRGAFARLARAEALWARGDHEGAREAIADARGRLLARAARIPDLGYRKSFLERVPENARTLSLALAFCGEGAA